ncbi:sporulation protein YqfD [Vermiculatibacterium agrestimuris]|uniref:sporulation protein YqfD n=1 Tax=Vermiculatibacterium agrestimuris TaxID=2941519 RepID=UPI00204206D7|nr:sporulation protein YqfD [Vermiculatibacterium agrestimuris]
MAVRSVINLLRGSVRLEVTGAFPERFLNLCAQQGTAFWAVDWPDSHTLRLTVAWQDREGLEELGERTGCTVAEAGRKGMPPFLLRFKKRYALLAGLALALLAVCFLGRFVMVVDVEGNEQVPTAVILTELRRLGLHPGVYGPSLNVKDISNEALLQLDDLSWMAVNLHGIRAQVVVREKIPKPELLDETVLGDIVSEAAGIVTRVEAWSGDPAVEVGDTVLAGEVLIRGSVRMDPPQYSEREPLWMSVRAMGRVEGRTWRTLTAAIPLTAEVKAAAGDEKKGWWITILGQRVNFYQNSGIPFERYDRISRTWEVKLPGGALPLVLGRETWRSYETAEASIDPAAAQAMLEQQLLTRLDQLLGDTGREVSHSFSAVEEDGLLKVTLTAECEEELGRFVPAS